MFIVKARLWFAFAMVSFSSMVAPPTGGALAQDVSVFKFAAFVDKLPEPDPATVRFDDACAMLSGVFTAETGFSDTEKQKFLSICSSHPDKSTCQVTKRFIEATGRPVPELVCKPGSKEAETPPQSAKPEQQPKAARPGQTAPMSAAKVIVKGHVTLSKQDGYTRLAFRFGKQIGVAVTQTDTVLVLNFSEPIDVVVQQLAEQAPDLIAAARRDPDDKAVRIALAHKVKLHGIMAQTPQAIFGQETLSRLPLQVSH